jgi:flagellar hook-associated protein 2
MAGLSGGIAGIASNLDTNSIVDALLTYDKQNITLKQYDQAVKTNQIATYQSINTRLLAFQTQAAMLARTDTYDATSVSVSDEDYATAAAGSSTATGTYSLNITALAQNHQMASQGFSEAEAANMGTGTITIAVGTGSPKTITIESGSGTLEGIKNAINGAKAGVKASIVNDGSSSNPYRLILTADKTGAKNKIVVSTDLTGVKEPNFTGASFDQVEKMSVGSSTTSAVKLGTTASFTGSKNKAYTFTVAGSGTQTVGSGDITLDWTDGTNSGSIVVSSADTEVELSGTGSDGLKLSFGAGLLTGGDVFQVQTFAPLLQKAQDAQVSMGSDSGGGSPIVVNSETNFVKDLIPGITLNLKKVTSGTPITINAERDVAGIREKIDTFISNFNDVMDSLDEQFKYDSESTDNTGILFGDRTLMMVQASMRQQVSSRVDGLSSSYRMLADVGIRVGSTGRLAVVDSSKLEAAIRDNSESLQKLLGSSGNSSNNKISFMSMTDKTKTTADGYDVDITQVATKGYLRGTPLADPSTTPLVIDSTNKNIAITVDGMSSGLITLTEKSYNSWDNLVEELQQKINLDEKIGSKGVEVSYFDNGETGYLVFTSGTYGKGSKVSIQSGVTSNGYSALGLAIGQAFSGQDVAGTINGELATGSGQILTGNTGNAKTSGLKLKVELDGKDLATGSEATVSVTRGIAGKASDFAESITKSTDGTFASRTKALQNQIDAIESEVADMNARIEKKRERLLLRFQEMEDAISKLNSTSSYLSGALSSLSSSLGSKSSSN